MKYAVKFKESLDAAEGTMSFRFEKPKGFDFKAGQSMDVTLLNPSETDAEGNTRPFSIYAAPHEDYIGFTTRMRDTAFKRVVKTMQPGTEVEIDGPMGSFTLHNDANKAAIFFAGGIGITPFFSIIKDTAHRKLPHHIYLYYSNRRPEDAAFLKELEQLQSENPNFKLIATMTDIQHSSQPWQGETGYINADMLHKYADGDLGTAICYLAGPPAMVTAMRQMLNAAGINDDNIRTEEFSGY